MKKLLPKVKLGDGTEVSVQASEYHYCRPRADAGPYTSVELGYPTKEPPPYILAYAEEADNPTKTVYGYVPVTLLRQWFAEAGGIIEGKLP